MADVSLIREATVIIFKETGDWLLPKWRWVINKLIKMNLSQKSYYLKTFLDGLDFGSHWDPRHYTYFFQANAVDQKQNILKIYDNFLT